MPRALSVSLFLLAVFPAHAEVTSNSTTSDGKSYAFCRHTLTTERLLNVRVAYMGTKGELRSNSTVLRDVYKLSPKTYTVTFNTLTEADKITGIRISCTHEQPNPNLDPVEDRHTQPWKEALWIPVRPGTAAGAVLRMNALVKEPAPGLREVWIGGFR